MMGTLKLERGKILGAPKILRYVLKPGKQIFIIHRIMRTDFLIAWNSFSHFFSDNINWVLNLIHDIFLLPLEVIL